MLIISILCLFQGAYAAALGTIQAGVNGNVSAGTYGYSPLPQGIPYTVNTPAPANYNGVWVESHHVYSPDGIGLYEDATNVMYRGGQEISRFITRVGPSNGFWITPPMDQADSYGATLNITNTGRSLVTISVSSINAKQGSFAGGARLGGSLMNFANYSNMEYAWIMRVTDANGDTYYGLNVDPLIPVGVEYNYNLDITIEDNAAVNFIAIAPIFATGSSVIADGNPSMTLDFLSLRPVGPNVSGTLSANTPNTDAGATVKLNWTVVFN